MIAAQRLTTRTLQDLRNVVAGLRPTLLDDLGLIPAIRWYARDRLEQNGIKFSINSTGGAENLIPTVKTNLYRIMQETIHNINQHSNAGHVNIKFENIVSGLHLEISDDGDGFNPELALAHAVKNKKLGLIGIKERVELINGKVDITSIPGSGTRIHIWVPSKNGARYER